MLERVIDNFNVRVAGVIQQCQSCIKHFINYLAGIRRKKLDVGQMFLAAKTFSGTSNPGKNLQENFINCGKYG